jgi:alpha-beta hydrolase superfamily lysophospholipase
VFRKAFRWVRSRPKRSLGLFLLAAFVLMNVLAYRHAYALTHYVEGAPRLQRLELLTLGDKVEAALLGARLPRPNSPATPADLDLPYDVHRLQSRDGTDLEAWSIGCPEAKGLVLMFHGNVSCKAALLPEAKAFRELGYATFLLDFRGSGGSVGNVVTAGMQEADDVAAAWEYARAQSWRGPRILYGQSMGSVAILRAVALRGVRPDALILECPFDNLLSAVRNRFSAMGVPAFPAAHLLVFWASVQHGCNGFTHDATAYARAVECPVLMLHGAEDARVSPEEARVIAENLSGPHRFEVFPGLGHQPYLRARPKEWKSLVSRFLTEQLRPTPPIARPAPGKQPS